MVPTPFAVETENLPDGVVAIVVRGELDLDTAPDLEAPLQGALDGEGEAILIDLSGCEFIDSTGIALLVRAWQRFDREAEGDGQGRLALCCTNDQVERILKITGVQSSIAMHRNREDALSSLSS